MLRDEHGVAAIRRLAAVVARLGGRESLGDQIRGVRAHCCRPTHECDRSIATPGPQVKLRAKRVARDFVEIHAPVYVANARVSVQGFRMRFADRVFVVTGGSRGIGRGIVKRLVEEGARAAIVDTDVHAGRDAEEEYGDHVRFWRADISREPDVRKSLTAIAKWGRRLDGLVNNAGVADPEVGPVERLALATWQRFLDVNLTGAFLMTKHAVKHLAKTRGAIVNIASTRALQSEPDTIAYAATKGGLVALTHALAVSLGPEIRVNCISPGWIATTEYLPRDKRHAPELSKADHEQHPAGRVGTPEDIAGLCAYLLSGEAGFVTGANFTVDGGMTRKMIYV